MLVSVKSTPGVSRWRRVSAEHWQEYAIEACGLGFFMISACSFGTLLGHPDSPLVRWIANPTLRRVLMGVAMGTTAMSLIYSRFGKRSGAHLNPATTITFLRLGKIDSTDALFYMVSHFLGAVAGVGLAGILLREWIAHPSVDYVVTLPGRFGNWWAFAA